MKSRPNRAWRSFFLIMGWVGIALWSYVNMLLIELYWNLVAWQPRVDSKSALLLLCVLANLAATFLLARVTRHPVGRAVSLLLCLILLGVGIYVLPAEPLGHGLFARTSSSPLWYRAGRLLVMALPSVFWSFCLLRDRREILNRPSASVYTAQAPR